MALNFLNNGYFAGKVGIGTESPTGLLSLNETPAASQAAPTLAFGDGDSGFYERFDDDIRVSIAGTGTWEFAANSFGGVNGGNSILNSETASTTNPTVIPYRNDPNTGLGGNGADILSLISGGVNGLNVISSGNVGIGTTTPDHKLRVVGDARIGNLHIKTADFGSGGTGKTIYADGAGSGVLGFTSTTAFDFSNGTTSRMRIDSSGNVGIGETSVDARLHISALASNGISNVKLESPGASKWAFGIPASQTYFALDDVNDNLTTPRLVVLKTSGNVGIGTTSPAGRLHVSDTATLTAVYQKFTNGTTGHTSNDGTTLGIDSDGDFLINNNEAKEIKLYTSDTQRLTISSAGAVKFNTYNTSNNTGTPTYLLGTDASGNIVKTNTIPGSAAGPYLPLTAGSTVPLSGDLYINNATYIRNTDSNGAVPRTFGFNSSNNMYIGPIDSYAGGAVFYGVSANVASHTLYTGGSARMIINSSGNVGIGTTSPTTKLNVSGNIAVSSGSYLSFIDSNLSYNKIGRNTSVGGIQITTGASATMNLLDNGNVGIGTTSPLGKLQVNEYTVASQGNQGVHGEVSVFANDGDESLFLGLKDSAYPDRGWAFNPVANGVNSDLQIKEHGSTGVRMTIKSVGNVGIGTTSPSQLLSIYKNSGDANFLINSNNGASQIFFGDTESDNVGNIRYDHGSNYMRFSTNAAEKMRITSIGGISFGSTGTAYGTSGQILKSNGNASPTWIDGSAIPGVPAGSGTLNTVAMWTPDGDTLGDSPITISGNNATFAGSITTTSVSGISIDTGGNAILTLDGASGSTEAIIFKHSGTEVSRISHSNSTNLIFSTGSSVTTALTLDASQNATFAGDITLDDNSGASPSLYLKNGDDNFWRIFNGSSLDLTFRVGTVTKFDIDSSGNGAFVGTVTSPTFLGDLNGTINTATTGVTQVNAIDNTTIATTAYVNNKIALIPAGLVFQGTWNASTNTPTLTSGSGTTGNFYIVSVAGSTNLDGITDWKVGDWAVFIEQGASDQWEKIDNSSVLDGIGTGQTLPLWAGSGTSNTLTDSKLVQNTAGTLITAFTNSLSNTGTFITNSEGGGEVGLTVQSRTNRAKLRVADNDSNAYVVAEAGKAFFGTSANGDATNITVLTSGNVGIGETSPESKLEISDSSIGTDPTALDSNFLMLTNKDLGTGAEVWGIGFNARSGATNYLGAFIQAYGYFQTAGNTGLIFGTRNTSGVIEERMRIDSAGNVGIGTDGPGAKLTVSENAAALVSSITNSSSSGSGVQITAANGTNNSLQIRNYAGGELMRVQGNGNVGIGTTSPIHPLYVDGDIGQTDGSRIWFRGSSSSSGTGAQSYVYSNGLNLQIKGDDNVQLLGDGGGVIAHFDYTGNVGIGTVTPQSKLQVAGGIQMADDTATAVVGKVGTMRYRTGTEYVEVDGVNLVTNPSFATDTNWTKETGWTITGGELVATAAAGATATYQSPGLTNGSIYKCTFTISEYTSGKVSFRAGTSAANTFFDAVGTYSVVMTAGGALQGRFGLESGVTTTLKISQCSIVEVTAEDASYADMCMQTGASTYEWVNIVRNTY